MSGEFPTKGPGSFMDFVAGIEGMKDQPTAVQEEAYTKALAEHWREVGVDYIRPVQLPSPAYPRRDLVTD